MSQWEKNDPYNVPKIESAPFCIKIGTRLIQRWLRYLVFMGLKIMTAFKFLEVNSGSQIYFI